MPRSGIYLIEVCLARRETVRVGRRGPVQFGPGRYVYVGSAMRALPHRILRHVRRRKKRRWHIDSLTTRGVVVGVWVWPPVKADECRFAEVFAASMPIVAGFGCSDCRCGGHLFEGSGAVAAELLRPEASCVYCWQGPRPAQPSSLA